MKRQQILFLISIILLISCTQTNKFSEEDYEWIPYKGNETLVFKSNTKEVDTIFILRKDTSVSYAEPQSVNGTKHEVISIFCKHSDSNMPDGKHRYLKNNFFQIEKTKDNRTEINILLKAKDAKFYRLSLINIDSLNKENASTLETQYGQYKDVFVISAEDYLGNLKQRSNFVTKVYWSKSSGLIRYDKKDNIYWELAKKW
ncbi:MAG: hypothetical protein ABIP79_07295 [Chitinophagaceae bacterium]